MSFTATPNGQKLGLSGAVTGNLRILVNQASGVGCLIHKGPTDANGIIMDEIFLHVQNPDSAQHTLTIQWGGTAVKDSLVYLLPAGFTGWLDCSGLPLQGQATGNEIQITAICDSITKVSIGGYANRLSN